MFRKLFGRYPRPAGEPGRPVSPPLWRRLALEPLEDRRLLALGTEVSGDVLTITSTVFPPPVVDEIVLSRSGYDILVNGSPVDGSGGRATVRNTDTIKIFPLLAWASW